MNLNFDDNPRAKRAVDFLQEKRSRLKERFGERKAQFQQRRAEISRDGYPDPGSKQQMSQGAQNVMSSQQANVSSNYNFADPSDTGNLDTGYTSDRPAPKAQQAFRPAGTALTSRNQDFTSVSTRDFMPNTLHADHGKGYMSYEQDRSRSHQFDAQARVNQAIQQAELGTNSKNMFKGLRQATQDTINNYDASSKRRQLALYGDIWNQKNRAPEWVSPEPPEAIKTSFGDRNPKDLFDD